jgi:hypothetical protein
LLILTESGDGGSGAARVAPPFWPATGEGRARREPEKGAAVAREVTDGEGITWTCAEAYAGLGGAAGDAAKTDGGRYRVVCTPSGGARSVELELPAGWEKEMDDAALLREIAAARQDGG